VGRDDRGGFGGGEQHGEGRNKTHLRRSSTRDLTCGVVLRRFTVFLEP
jgi:hypothetical protein